MSKREQKKVSHRDCRNYAPLDAAKGLCRKTSDLIPADEKICERFSCLPRCCRCTHYQADADKPLVGICGRSSNHFMAYADMTARTCADFQELS
jgi:4-hydroxyphenylacetate decarboxylase small subunit